METQPVQLLSVTYHNPRDQGQVCLPAPPALALAQPAHTQVRSAPAPVEAGRDDGTEEVSGNCVHVIPTNHLSTDGTHHNNLHHHAPTIPPLPHNGGDAVGGGDVANTSTPQASSKPSRLQIIIIMLGSLGHLVMGMSTSWPNSLVSHLIVDNTTLFNTELELTANELDLIGSIPYIALLITVMPAGWIVARLGRKCSIIVSAVPSALGWFLIAFTQDVFMMLVGRFLCAVGLALTLVGVRTYMTEIASTSIRGLVISYLDLMKGVGSVVVTGLAPFLPWYHIAFLSGGIILLFGLAILPFFPESPTFLVVRSREDEAQRVLHRLRVGKTNVENELALLRSFNNVDTTNSGWASNLKPSVLKSMGVIFGLFVISAFSGTEVVRVNMTRMLQNSSVTLDLQASTIIVMCVLLCGSLSLTVLIDRIGRCWCLFISFLMLCVAFTVLGFYSFLVLPHSVADQVDLASVSPSNNISSVAYQSDLRSGEQGGSWLPLFCFVIAGFSINLGVGSVPFALCVEYFPTSIRPQAMSMCLVVAMGTLYLSLQLYTVMLEGLTQAGLYWCYALFAALGIVYTHLFVNETSQQNVG